MSSYGAKGTRTPNQFCWWSQRPQQICSMLSYPTGSMMKHMNTSRTSSKGLPLLRYLLIALLHLVATVGVPVFSAFEAKA
jgi:hypothetical protein